LGIKILLNNKYQMKIFDYKLNSGIIGIGGITVNENINENIHKRKYTC